MPPVSAYSLALAVIMLLLVAVWLIQLRTRNAGLVDVAWSAAVGIVALLLAALGDAPAGLRWLLALLAGVWSFRLAGHLALRMHGEPEDRRYAALRAHWGPAADRNMLFLFLFQAVAAWLLALPFLVLAYRPDWPAAVWVVLAAAVWLVSVAGEGLADWQLYRFKRNPANRGKVCAEGLWRYSRHPNYFFESLHWVSYGLLALGAPYAWAAWLSPVLMALLLLKVSGIPTVETKDAESHRAGYAAYVRSTSAFFPMPPRKAR